MAKVELTIASKTDVGKVRNNNEDSILTDKNLGLFIVADGMGGHQAGEVASRMAIELLQQNLKNMAQGSIRPEKFNENLSLEANQLAFCAQLTNQAIYEASKRYPEDHGMGTTLSAGFICDSSLIIAHVGDSRIYIFRNNQMEQITQDHSLVMEQVRKGILKKEEAEKSKLSNVLLRAIGTEKEVQVDVEEHPLLDGDIILFCSDGLTKMVPEDQMLAIIRSAKDPQIICDTMIEAANASGGVDNISVIVARAQVLSGIMKNLKSKISGLKSNFKRGNNHA